MDASFNGFFTADNDPSAPTGGSGQSATETKKNLVSVSLSQVAMCTRHGEGFVLHRCKVSTITTVGLVMSVQEVTTKILYTIDDQSRGGPIDVQFWKNDDEMTGTTTTSAPPSVMEHTYIRVFGTARFDEAAEKPHIVAFKIVPISDPNEIILHHLQVIYDSVVLEYRKNDALMGNTSMSAGDGGFMADEGFGASRPAPMMGGFTELQTMVLNLITEKSRDEASGIHVNEVCSALNRAAARDKILKTVDFLAQEGHIFSTTDEYTYKSTDV